jgi:uncharacterized protein (DUF1697 family)
VPTHVALLRGVNVGGHNKVAMSDLREVVGALGHTDVATYIQSGNVVFTSADAAAESSELAAALEGKIAQMLTVRPSVVVLSRAELAQVIASNPYPHEMNPQCLHGGFQNAEMRPEQATAVTAAQRRAREKGSRDEVQVIGRALYLHTPDGLGRSVLAALLSGSTAAGTATTMRNWATVRKLMALLDA